MKIQKLLIVYQEIVLALFQVVLYLVRMKKIVPLGIVLGLFVGKQLGVFIFSYISIKLKIAEMPNNSNWMTFYGVGVLTGIGFTMSLFVGNLAFVNDIQYLDGVKIGVLLGSLLSTVFGYLLILFYSKK